MKRRGPAVIIALFLVSYLGACGTLMVGVGAMLDQASRAKERGAKIAELNNALHRAERAYRLHTIADSARVNEINSWIEGGTP